ncbi:Sir2 family histone deacetylase Hst2 [Ramaria rubella]|nr:Sir2 family histone deacetylase Hst2 [Ramaria rubella]
MTGEVGPPTILDERSLPGIARYIQSDECKRIFVMTGAGISTAAGIPDFRSPDTGLYANLARLELPYPEAVFDIRFFRVDPLPFYTLAHELAPGRYRPTRTHSFIRLLHEKNLLHTCFTQNIDTLERRSGLPDYRIVEAHGSFASQKCIDCKAPYSDEKMKGMIREKTVPKCEHCGGLVKPDIVFFGEALPPKFHKSIYNLGLADLLIIIGTSLTVHPFASLTGLVAKTCPRVLINLEAVGDIGDLPDDVVVLGKCDDVIQRLCELLHWEEELENLWGETKNSVDPKGVDEEAADDVEEEVKHLTEEVEKNLKIKAELKKANEEKPNKQEDPAPTTDGKTIEDHLPVGTTASTDQVQKDMKASGNGNKESEPDDAGGTT